MVDAILGGITLCVPEVLMIPKDLPTLIMYPKQDWMFGFKTNYVKNDCMLVQSGTQTGECTTL